MEVASSLNSPDPKVTEIRTQLLALANKHGVSIKTLFRAVAGEGYGIQ